MNAARSRVLAVAATLVVTGSGAAVTAGPASALPASAASASAVSAVSAAVAAWDGGPGHGARITDIGEHPAIFAVERETLENRTFRTAAWTADTLQLTLMSIPVGGDVGLEMHENVDQFLRIERGTALVMMGTKQHLNYVKRAGAGDVILIPSGTWHNVVNTGSGPLKLYSLYGPAQHPYGTVHQTQADDPHSAEPKPRPRIGPITPITPVTKDRGAVPLVFDIDAATASNTNYRFAVWTADTLQLTLMSIPVHGDVGLEMHPAVDQFIRIESGRARVYFGDTKGSVRLAGIARAGDAVLIPSGTWHNVVNDSPKEPLQLYSLYGPANHPQGTVQKTKPAAD